MQLYTKILIGMLVGVVFGLLLGPNSSLLPNDGVRIGADAVVTDAPDGARQPLAEGLRDARVTGSQGEWLKIEYTLSPAHLLRLKSSGVKAAETASTGKPMTGWVKDEVPTVLRYAPIGQTIVDCTEWMGRLFLAMIKMVVVPLVFFSLVVGIASLGDVRKLGRMGGRTLGFFMGTTVAALTIGVGLANLIRPGELLSEADRDILLSSYSGSTSGTLANAAEAPSLADQLISIVPNNPFSALAAGDMLQVIFFAMMLGVALTFLKDNREDMVVDLFDRLNEPR